MIHKFDDFTGHIEYGIYHRENGPAKCTKNSQEWIYQGRFSRKDGPARMFKELPDGQKLVCEWWFDGQFQYRCEMPEQAFNDFWFKE